MAFTGQLGTRDSRFGYIALGTVASVAGPAAPTLTPPLYAERLDGPTRADPA